MRGLFLVLLGAGLFWLVVSNFGSSDGDAVRASGGPGGASVADGTEEGRMLARPAAVPSGAPGDAESAATSSAPASWTPPAPSPRVDDGEVGGGAGGQGWMRAGLEEDLAARVLHDPQSLPRFFEEEGRDLPTARKELALAFVNALHGRIPIAREYAVRVAAAPEVDAAERELLRSVLEGRQMGPVSASTRRSQPLLLAVRIGLRAAEARRHLDEGRHAEAARGFSDVLLEEVDAPWPADRRLLEVWSADLLRAQERHRWNRHGEWPSVEVEVRPDDSLTGIRKRVLREHPRIERLCVGLIDRANELDGAYVHPGDRLRIPTDPVRVLIDLEARWLLYLHADEVVAAWKVGIGKPGQETRPGHYVAGEKIEEPTWFRPGQEPVPFGDPENALGTRWIGWNRPNGERSDSLGIHGTNDPSGVGGQVSRGCVRMHDADVETLFEVVPVGTPIEVRG